MTKLAAGLADFRRLARDVGPLWACSVAADHVLPLGLLRLWPARSVAPAMLGQQVGAILSAWGFSDEHAAICSDRILYADLRGIDSHGSSMLPFYQRLRDLGRLNPRPRIAVVREDASTAVLDADGGLGHVPGTRAMSLAIEKCSTSGVAVVAVRNSGHFGAAGAYAAMAAERGLIGVATTSTPTPSVVPTFGREARLGTNAISLAAPALSNRPFLLDMATSTASLGKLLERWRAGRALPRGWALDGRGRTVTNGRAAAELRRLTPLGGDRDGGSHKGYGLAVAVEILSSVLSGTTRVSAGPRPVGHFFLALDPARFCGASRFGADLDDLLDSLRESPRADPAQPVLVAGDPEEDELARRTRDGIPLTRSVFEDLRSVARAAGTPFLLED